MFALHIAHLDFFCFHKSFTAVLQHIQPYQNIHSFARVSVCTHMPSKAFFYDVRAPTAKWSVEWRGARKVRGGEWGKEGTPGWRGGEWEKENSHFTGYCPSWYDRHQGAQTSTLAQGGRDVQRIWEREEGRRRDTTKQQRDREISQL